MRQLVMCGVACGLLLSAGCASHKKELGAIEQLAEEGKFEQADEAYEDFLQSTELDDEPWREISAARCEVLEKSLRQKLAAMSTPARAELLALLQESQVCAPKYELDEELFALMIAQTERDIEREIQPLYEEKAYGEMLARASDYVSYLPADHRYAKWFMQVRTLMAKSWRAQGEKALERQLFATSFLFTMLADDADRIVDVPVPPHITDLLKEKTEKIVLPFITPRLVSLEVSAEGDSCASRFASSYRDELGEGPLSLPARAKLSLSSCSVEVTSTTDASGQVTMHAKFVLQGFMTSELEGASEGSGQSFDATFDVSRYADSVWTTSQTLDALFLRGMVVSPPDSALAKLVRERVEKMHPPKQLGESLYATARTASEERVALERILAAFFITHAIDEESRQRVVKAFGPNPALFPHTMIPVFAWYKPGSSVRMPRRIVSSEESTAALNQGFPLVMSSFALGFGMPEQDLVGQPDRSAFGLSVDTPMRKALLKSQGKLRGMGLLLGVDLGFHVGKRFGGDYQDVTTPTDVFIYEPDEELGSFGFNIDAPLMVGRRGSRLGVFAGIKPGFMHRSFGFYKTQGSRRPLAGRLEWRRQSGLPVVLEGWWGGLAQEHDNSSTGGQLIIVTASDEQTTTGWKLSGQRDTLPAHFYGLNQRDRVRLEQADLTTASVGYWIGY